MIFYNHCEPHFIDISGALITLSILVLNSQCKEGARDVKNITVTAVICDDLYKDPAENNLICIILLKVLTALTFALKSRKFGIRCSRFGIEIKFVFLFSISQIIHLQHAVDNTAAHVLDNFYRVSQ